MALPAHADAGKIFDFNLTLPIMAGQFLLLMVFLDKFWFGPVGKVLDERDGYIRDQLKKFKVSPRSSTLMQCINHATDSALLFEHDQGLPHIAYSPDVVAL